MIKAHSKIKDAKDDKEYMYQIYIPKKKDRIEDRTPGPYN